MRNMKMDSSNETSTQRFLIHCLRGFLKVGAPSLMDSHPTDVVDWSALLQLASWHKVVPLLYRSLQANCREDIPEDVGPQIKTLCRDVLSRNLLLTKELIRLVKLFESNGIQSIPLKGPVLAFSLYKDVALRQSVDIDILVQEQDYQSARSLLLSLGYKPLYRLTVRQKRAYLRLFSHENFTIIKDNTNISAELHDTIREPGNSFQPDEKNIWQRCETVSIAGTKMMTLSAEDLLLYLCAHGSKHQWRCLQWLCDIAQVVRIHATRLDWGRVMHKAQRSGSQRMLFLGLFLTDDILGAPIPDEILQKIKQDPLTMKLVRQVRCRLLNGAPIIPGGREVMIFRSRLKWKNGLDRFLYFIRDFSRAIIIPTPADWMSIPLPDALFPLYYVLRPMRLTGKYGLKAVNSIYNLCKGKIK